METGTHELTAGYALDALDLDERRAYEAHLATCEQCQRELASFWEATEALAVAASGPAPSPALRERILADVRAEPPQNVVPLESRRRRTTPALAAVAAVAAVVALAIGLWASDLSGELDDTRAALERERTAAAIVADLSSRTIDLASGNGRLVVDPAGRAALVLSNLGPAPAGQTYQAWIVEDGNPISAGIFPGEDGLDIVLVEGDVAEGEIVAVTVEQAGGAEAPTLPPLVASDPV
ncbi:MAG TPA: anti-sigma factor [Gaiellaceae bacterium]|nr:anti-sigma factor [Gaiellaceae bacterium]